MDAAALVADLRSRGVELRVEGDRVRFRPKEKVSPALVEQITRLKPGVIEILSAESRPRRPIADRAGPRTCACRSCGGDRFWALATVGYWVCGNCHAPDFAPSELVWMQIDRGGAA